MTGATVGRTPGGIRYTVHGTGEPVLLVAGNGGSGAVWEQHQVPALTAAGHQVITFDRHDTDANVSIGVEEVADDIRELAAALDLPPGRLIGHSFGALAVQELLLSDPGQTTQAVLVATRGRPDAVGEALTRAEQARAAWGLRLPAEYEAFVRLTQNLSPRTLADEGAAENWVDLFELSVLADRSPGHGTRALASNRLPAYAAITTPLLVVGFADDLLAPARLGREVADAVPGGRYLELADCGHLGFLERPHAFNEAVLRFFAGSESATCPPLPGDPHVH